MTREHILSVTNTYKNEIADRYPRIVSLTMYNSLIHCYFMLQKIDKFVRFSEYEKAFRWLGFVQGVFWMNDIYTIDEMRDHNREQ